MPIYEYQCGACGCRLEKLQKMTDVPLLDCPECSETALKKLVSAAAFRLKGEGWYETDFKTGSKRNLVEDGKSEPSSSGSSSSDNSSGTDNSSSKSSAGEDKPPKKGTSKPAASDSAK
ncbi:MAG: zinc ribbon domain-containing protein [Pseudomonadales bacterium]|jgi:putative FmdB family regulatory protein|nr:zinc ribbon domain-containing protein [Pseudomonadales bacterium]MDP7358366.1 zinc ribbon domain-containing protein [Pseudomonadales bacterium]MDP7596880.1 zinc ribbon domain-containing protein [Pseudomonadales bacterium]|tara:strand:- start:89 stop:442 length:354 start_codon:yes stop_codon:yes gene_type:complete